MGEEAWMDQDEAVRRDEVKSKSALESEPTGIA